MKTGLNDKKESFKTKGKHPATASHEIAANGESVVKLGNLRVLITQDEDAWFAHGLEIDYAAQGSSVEDVQHIFQDGLMSTITAYLEMFGTLAPLLTPAPKEIWEEATMANVHFHSQTSNHVLDAQFPYDAITFYTKKAA